MLSLFITPSDRSEGFEYVHSGRENLGVEYLLASLRADGQEVLSRNENIPRVAHENADWKAFDLIGFSLPFWEYRAQYVAAINWVAEKTGATLIAGGHAATIGAKYFLAKCPRLLGVVMGEGEETLRELVQCLETGSAVHAIAGLMSREFYQPRFNLKPLDDLPFPARDELRLSHASNAVVKEALVESTRGCTYRCSFCSIPLYYKYAHGKQWRERSVVNVCNELTQLVAEFPDVDLISFTDDNFMGFNSRFHERAIRIARHLRSLKPQLAFEIVCRVDAVEPEAFRELASLGMAGVYLGIESGVQRVLDSFRKNTTVRQNLRAIEILSELGIGCDVGFITFSPGMTVLEVRQNFEFLSHIIEKYPIFVHPAAVFRCLREYPNDLGEAAIREDGTRDLSRLSSPIQAMYEAIETIWHKECEADFIRNEGLAATRGNDPALLAEQKAVTGRMLQIAFAVLREVEKHNELTVDDLFAGYVHKDCGKME